MQLRQHYGHHIILIEFLHSVYNCDNANVTRQIKFPTKGINVLFCRYPIMNSRYSQEIVIHFALENESRCDESFLKMICECIDEWKTQFDLETLVRCTQNSDHHNWIPKIPGWFWSRHQSVFGWIQVLLRLVWLDARYYGGDWSTPDEVVNPFDHKHHQELSRFATKYTTLDDIFRFVLCADQSTHLTVLFCGEEYFDIESKMSRLCDLEHNIDAAGKLIIYSFCFSL